MQVDKLNRARHVVNKHLPKKERNTLKSKQLTKTTKMEQQACSLLTITIGCLRIHHKLPCKTLCSHQRRVALFSRVSIEKRLLPRRIARSNSKKSRMRSHKTARKTLLLPKLWQDLPIKVKRARVRPPKIQVFVARNLNGTRQRHRN